MKKLLTTLIIVLSVLKGIAGCGGIYNTTSGQLASPKAAGDITYPNNAYCYWELHILDGKAIQIKFNEMDIEEDMVCEYDYLKVNDGLTPRLYHCGTELPKDLILDSRMAVVMFRSDDSIRRNGFKLTFSHIEDPTCGYHTWRNVGRFGSFDTDIKPGSCTWAIRAPRVYVALQVFVTKLGVTPNENCELEYVEIYDDYEVFGRYCGLEPMTVITTTENVLYVDLVSDVQDGATFEAYYARSDLNGKCGGIMSQPSGNISSFDGDNDGMYDDNQDCIWTIIAPVDNVVRLEFLNLELEYTEVDDCFHDFLTIYDGSFEEGAIHGIYCGGYSPGVVWSTSNILTVHFMADGALNKTNKRGFDVTYAHKEERERDCGEFLQEPSGFFHSPDIDSNGEYESDQDFLWTLSALEGQVIYLKFTEFDLEADDAGNCKYDFVEVFDGKFGENSFGKYCADEGPQVLWSTSNVLAVHFYSVSYAGGIGFTAKYSFYNDKDDFVKMTTKKTVETTENTVETTRETVETTEKFMETTSTIVETTKKGVDCGGYYTQPSGFIHSPDEDNDGLYEANQTCKWTITALEGQVILLMVLKIDIEYEADCSYDYIEVYDGEFGESFSIGRYCNGIKPPVIWSTSNILVIFFMSDHWYSGEGFNASYKFYNATDRNSETTMKTTTDGSTTVKIVECGENYTQPSGFIHSPDKNNDGQYELYQLCIWTIIALEGQVIHLKFVKFDIEAENYCGYDHVEVYDGEFGESFSIGKYCNGNHPPEIWSTTNILVIFFMSDHVVTAEGFNASYKFYNTSVRSDTTMKTTTESMVKSTTASVRASDTTMKTTTESMVKSTTEKAVGCGGFYTQPSGSIHSPDEDNNGEYEINKACNWTITALEGQVIHLKFLKFDIEPYDNCIYDYVEVFDGEYGETFSIGKYCNGIEPPAIWSTSNILVISFISDDMFTFAGFKASYKFYNADKASVTTMRTTTENKEKSTTEHAGACGALMTHPSGTIQSPDNDNNGEYENDQDCLWTISAPKGQGIYLKFLAFEIEPHETCDLDFVDIKEVFEDEFGGSQTQKFGKFCNNNKPTVISSSSNLLMIYFHSNSVKTMGGFKATYNFYDVPDRSSVSTMKTPMDIPTSATEKKSFLTVESTTFETTSVTGQESVFTAETTTYKTSTVYMYPVTCGEFLNSASGYIVSPDLDKDGEYETEKNCIWTITAQEHQVILLKFLEFDIRCNYDFVEIREYLQESDDEWATSFTHGIYCGTKPPKEIWSTSNTLVVQFYSDESETATGFVAFYKFYKAEDKPVLTTGDITDKKVEETTTWINDFFP